MNITLPSSIPYSSRLLLPRLTRRGFLKSGGVLVVSFATPRLSARADTSSPLSISIASWLELRDDGTIIVRTGRTEIGTGMSGYYPQVIAEELCVHPSTIRLIMGDTDRTPDGGYSAGFLTGADNLRKVGAYTYQALLRLAAKKLRTPIESLTVEDGIVSGNGQKIRYTDLVRNQHLDLTIPVSGDPAAVDSKSPNGVAGLDGLVVLGNPPTRPMSQYKFIGSSNPMPGIPDKVTGRTQWTCDVALPNMLHARMVRPSTLGGTLISAGKLDKTTFPTAQLVVKKNLVAVLSPNEWEAINAAQTVAADTKWTEWAGLPTSDKLTETLRSYKWGAPSEGKGNAEETAAAFNTAAQKIDSSYEQPFMKHAPIGPFVAVADVRPDGSVTVWSHSANSQGLRAQIAYTLSTSIDKVVVRWLDHAAQFGRTTFGGDGAESDAAILSQITGRPVRVQWMLPDDLAWSANSPGWAEDISCSLDSNHRITAVKSSFYSLQSNDMRMVGAILAGMPTCKPQSGYWIATEWPYDRIPHRREEVYGMPTLGSDSPSGVGLRGLIMRTPGQRQQNFALESLINEAAAATGTDPIAFRLAHTTDQRLIELIHATAKAAEWQSRPSPNPDAHGNNDQLHGRGMCLMVRQNACWVGIAEIIVTRSTGAIQVEKFTIGADPGKIINPRQLERCMLSGVVMGISEALKEEVTFDTGKITSTLWSSYKILTMAEMPEIKTVQISHDDKGYGGGSEAANAICPPAIAAAFHDATGIHARRIPLTPAYVNRLLHARA
ncbi:molybdopterin cofactor-binding domain-containing protein [Edaphobacter flagellatus]|uniref:molybdopterin cofactor-binding domain-containing protein n=1 Tax=Edaphobacter flagellatus TaxID=1933044 RepID=UPI0021B18EEC|nr:molybdopterin cofactor-binding domain-containing protein [Edaphobacter flagellatus]